MPRFSVAFNRRKSIADPLDNVEPEAPAQPSFRVIERNPAANVRSFDGGARLARAAGTHPVKSTHLDVADDNIFADFKGNRGSNVSNTTQTTSTDNSSRHSNASTAPSSADMGGGNSSEETTKASKPAQCEPELPGRGQSTKSISASLFKASRTFSFGGQKKNSVPPPEDHHPLPDLPPILTLNTDDAARTRSLTKSPLTSPGASSLESGPIDLGGDFSAMFSGIDKRESMSTVRNDGATNARSLTGGRQGRNLTLSPDIIAPGEPLLGSNHSPISDEERDFVRSGSFARQPSAPRYQPSSKSFNRPADIVEDEDAKLLHDSFAAMRFLSGSESNGGGSRYQRELGSDATFTSRPVASAFSREDNMFEETSSRFARVSHRYVPKTVNPPRNRVMTPAQFERYRQDKERQGTEKTTNRTAAKDEEDDEDEINYDDEEDEAEKSRQQAKQRRKQEAHMAVYRQQMMKVTGEPAPTLITPTARPGLPSSASAPQLNLLKPPSPNLAAGSSDEDDDEEVPLAILQAHGFPNKDKPPPKLTSMASSNQLRVPSQSPGRPSSSMGDSGGSSHQRTSTLPAFARRLPQDPFVGAGIAQPAVRESMSFHNVAQNNQGQGLLPPGGLVGVIATEERSRAMRRGSPNIDSGKGMFNSPPLPYGQEFDPAGGVPPQMMYGQQGIPQSMPQMMPMIQQPMISPGEQAQLQMTQQMSQFMQMQMQFMQIMSMNQPGATQGTNQQPMAQFPASQSMAMPYARQSVIADPMGQRGNQAMRPMSMARPSSSSMIFPPSFGRPDSIQGMNAGNAGYAPSIAPSERSNVGLPGRYRPVSQAGFPPKSGYEAERTSSMSGAIPDFSSRKIRPSVDIVAKSTEGSDDDDDEGGWEAMKAKRDKKKTLWKNKKSYGTELSAIM